jgi:nucleoside-diphosphate-sugar epimerase
MTTTLITGADGHVGKALAHWLIENSRENLLLLVRANSSEEQSSKFDALGELATSSRCSVVFSDLRDEIPFKSVSPAQVTNIIHCAAVTSFAVNQETAREVNIEGTRKLVHFAETCSGLRRFCLISSLYTAGLQDGIVPESSNRNKPHFANYYEWSKWHAEQLVVNAPTLPWQIFRVATIIGEDNSGKVVQQNAIHNTLRLFYYGLLSIVPGKADTRVYMVSTEFVTAAIGALLTLNSQNGITKWYLSCLRFRKRGASSGGVYRYCL